MDISSIFEKSASDADKVDQLRCLASKDPSLIDSIPESQSNLSTLKIMLLKIELYITHGHDSKALELLKLLQNNPQVQQTPDLKLVFDNLQGDCQYLNSGKFIELVNKKLNILNTSEADNTSKAQIYRNLLHLVLLSGPDFLKRNLLIHLQHILASDDNQEETDPSSVSKYLVNLLEKETKIVYHKMLKNQFVSIEEFEDFTRVSIYKRPKSIIFYNYIKNNISFLPKYYDNVSLSKIKLLFQIPDSVDLEDLISDMIVNDQLPEGSQIDQIDSILYFNQVNETNSIREREICGLLDKITTLIDKQNI